MLLVAQAAEGGLTVLSTWVPWRFYLPFQQAGARSLWIKFSLLLVTGRLLDACYIKIP